VLQKISFQVALHRMFKTIKSNPFPITQQIKPLYNFDELEIDIEKWFLLRERFCIDVAGKNCFETSWLSFTKVQSD